MPLQQKNKTVFILGAGASVPYGFPDGKKLRNNIINQFKREVKNLLKDTNWQANADKLKTLNSRMDNFLKHFEKSRTYIDLFLTRRKGDYDELGIVAIFNEILKAERNCNFRTVKVEDDWLFWFFNIFTEGMIEVDEITQLQNWNYSFITFNYDRVLEKYLQSAIMANWGKTKNAQIIINKVMNSTKIFHVYGSLGPLSWQKSDLTSLSFGDKCSYDDLLLLSKNIGIMHNDRNNHALPDIQKELLNADRVFFLGFSFAQENLKQLDIPNVFHDRPVRIFATALGYSNKEIQRITTKLVPNKNWPYQPKVVSTDCLGLLREFLFD